MSATSQRQALGCWLAPGVLALIVVADVDAETRGLAPLAEHDGDPETVRARWLLVARGDERRAATWLLTVLPNRADGTPLGRLLLGGDGARPLTSEPVERSLCEPAELGRFCATLASDDARERIQRFLASTPSAHRIELEAELAASLAAVHTELRDPSRTAGAGDGASLDAVTRLDSYAFLLSGRLRHGSRDAAVLEAISPEGVRAPLAPGTVAWLQRPGTADGIRFHAFAALDCPSRHPDGWALSVQTGDGAPVEVAAQGAVETEAETAESGVLEALAGRSAGDPILSDLALPALERLRSLDHGPRIADVIDHGSVPARPDVSVIVDLRQTERAQLLLGEYDSVGEGADGSAPGALELIFVVAATDAELAAIAGVHDLYRTPFRVARLTHSARRARAFNLGASVARGGRLLFVSDELSSTGSGWITELQAALGDGSRVGAVAPKLVDVDGAIVSAGHDYVLAQPSSSWQRDAPLAGASRAAAGAQRARRVTAASDACLMVSASRFHACDGFADLYIAGGEEAGDLCLRLRRGGFDTWYVPGAEVVAPGAAARPAPAAPEARLFDDWLFARRWGATLALEAAPRSPGPDQPPGGRMARLVVEPATPDASWVSDARLLVADVDTEMSPYDNTYTIPVHGWARASDGAPLAVEAIADGRVVATTNADRTDDALVAGFPAAAGAGFELMLGSLGLPAEFEVSFDAVRPDGARSRLGSVRGSRSRLSSSYSPQLAPVLVTTLGRSGSNWMLALLNAHPEIVVFRPFQYEGAMLNYWVEFLHASSAPASYVEAVLPQLGEERWWLGDGRQLPMPHAKPGAEMLRWLGGPNIERIAGFAQSRVDEFYLELAGAQRKSTARRFAEKLAPARIPRTVCELYPDAREIVLVRDFRDRVCSIVDYTAKVGADLWGYTGSLDERWLELLRTEAAGLVDHWREVQDRAVLVRYEDLMREPRPTLARVVSHLGLAGGDVVVDRMLLDAGRSIRHGQEFHRTAPSFESSVGRWQRDLPEDQRRACAEAFDDLLPEFGYAPTLG